MEPSTRGVLLTSLIAGITGGAALFAIVGAITDRAVWGGVSGSVIGALISWGRCSGLISPGVVWMSCFAAAGAFIGPGCDADALSSAILFGAVGAFVGYMPWSGLIALIGALVTVNIHPTLFLWFIFGACLYFYFYFARNVLWKDTPSADRGRSSSRSVVNNGDK